MFVPKDTVRLPAAATAAATTASAAATTTAAAATATTAATTAAAAEATTTAAGRLGPSFVHVDGAPVEFGAIQLGNGRFGIALFGHFDEGEAARLPGVTIRNDVDALDVPVLGECGMQVLLRGLVAEVPDKNVGHQKCSFVRVKRSASGGA
jgi:hypothetical protein